MYVNLPQRYRYKLIVVSVSRTALRARERSSGPIMLKKDYLSPGIDRSQSWQLVGTNQAGSEAIYATRDRPDIVGMVPGLGIRPLECH